MGISRDTWVVQLDEVSALPSPWGRLGRRLLVAVLAAVGLAGMSWARTPGPYFESLQSGNAAAFDNVPVLFIRSYLNIALATYEKACPDTAPAYTRPWALAAYVMKPPSQGLDPASALASNGLWVMTTRRWADWNEVQANGENDVLWLKETSGCSAAAHRAWVANAKAMAENPRIAGPFPQAQALCEASGSSASLCSCFATSYDMEATPADRRRVLDSKPQLEGLRATLRNDDLSARVVYKCEASPPIVSPDTEYLHTSDEQHRLKEGVYRMFFPLARAQAGQTCEITRKADWRYRFECLGTGVGTLSRAGDVLTVDYTGIKTDDTFDVLSDGTLRLRSTKPNVAMDLVPTNESPTATWPRPQVGGQGRAPPNPGAAGRGPTKASPQECARKAQDLQRLRDRYPTSVGIMKREERLRQLCGQ